MVIVVTVGIATTVAVAGSLAAAELLCGPIRRGDEVALRYWLERGVPVNWSGVDGTPILWAVMKRQPRMVAMLLDFGADPDEAVSVAVTGGHLDILRMLDARGIDLTARCGAYRQPPIDVARGYGHHEVVAFLEDVARRRNRNGVSPPRHPAP